LAPTPKPTGQPTTLPSSQPSCTPTSQPSCTPTNQPSCQPSSTPTTQPSGSPTSTPTSQPTLSEDTTWLARLPTFETNVTNHYSDLKSTYSELTIGVKSSYITGGCNIWSVFTLGTLFKKSFDFLPQNITVATLTGYSFSPNITTNIASCDNKNIVKKIVDAIAGVDYISINETCQENVWITKKCGRYPSLCVNCDDPCVASKDYDQLVFTPCAHASDESNAIRILSIDYVPPKPAPNFEVSVEMGKTNASLSFKLTDNGNIICGVFDIYVPPTSPELIQMQGYTVSVMNSDHIASMNMYGLQPSSQYDLYCTTISTDNIKMAWNVVLGGKIRIETDCCKIVEAVLSINSVSQNKDGGGVLNAISFTMSSLPMKNITFQFSAYLEDRRNSSKFTVV
jgi:hypothetical protein